MLLLSQHFSYIHQSLLPVFSFCYPPSPLVTDRLIICPGTSHSLQLRRYVLLQTKLCTSTRRKMKHSRLQWLHVACVISCTFSGIVLQCVALVYIQLDALTMEKFIYIN